MLMNEIVALKNNQEISDLPESKLPFYIAAKEGLFLHRKIILGTAVIRSDKMPPHLGEIGNKEGMFWWDAPVIPAKICAQAVHFFRRIWEKHKTEAEVLITYHFDKKEYRLFIPTQKVSSTSVQSVYEPTHIAPGYLVVGTMHSHCNFSAFHSGTDEQDADGMDGIHITVGYVDKEKPEVVSMVSVNKVKFHYEPEVVADFSDLTADTAPEWWDRYVIPSADLTSTHKPVGYSNFAKYSDSTPNKIVKYPYYQNGPYPPKYNNYGYDNLLDDYDENFLEKLFTQKTSLTPLKRQEDTYFEDYIPKDIRDLLFDSELVTDGDIDEAIRKGKNAGVDFWKIKFVEKFLSAADVLTKLGMSVVYDLEDEKPKVVKNG